MNDCRTVGSCRASSVCHQEQLSCNWPSIPLGTLPADGSPGCQHEESGGLKGALQLSCLIGSLGV